MLCAGKNKKLIKGELMSQYRSESDTMGTVEVPIDRYWGAQTQRSLVNFAIGEDVMPLILIRAFAVLKKICGNSKRRSWSGGS